MRYFFTIDTNNCKDLVKYEANFYYCDVPFSFIGECKPFDGRLQMDRTEYLSTFAIHDEEVSERYFVAPENFGYIYSSIGRWESNTAIGTFVKVKNNYYMTVDEPCRYL